MSYFAIKLLLVYTNNYAKVLPCHERLPNLEGGGPSLVLLNDKLLPRDTALSVSPEPNLTPDSSRPSPRSASKLRVVQPQVELGNNHCFGKRGHQT